MSAIKKGVKLYGTRPEMSDVNVVVHSVFFAHNIECVVTSGVRAPDGKSLHGAGFAKDYRANHIASQSIRDKILSDLKEKLPCCDIVLHGEGDNIHYHVEFDPKDDSQFQADKAFYKTHGNWPHR